MGIPDHLTCLLRNAHVGQEATVRTGHGTADWFQIGKGVHQGCILSPCLFNLYAQYIMWNAGLYEAQAGIKIARRNINNLRYADDTTLMAESEEELKSLLMKVKEDSEKDGLKLTFRKKRSWHPVPSLHGRDWETVESVTGFILGSPPRSPPPWRAAPLLDRARAVGRPRSGRGGLIWLQVMAFLPLSSPHGFSPPLHVPPNDPGSLC